MLTWLPVVLDYQLAHWKLMKVSTSAHVQSSRLFGPWYYMTLQCFVEIWHVVNKPRSADECQIISHENSPIVHCKYFRRPLDDIFSIHQDCGAINLFADHNCNITGVKWAICPNLLTLMSKVGLSPYTKLPCMQSLFFQWQYIIPKYICMRCFKK